LPSHPRALMPDVGRLSPRLRLAQAVFRRKRAGSRRVETTAVAFDFESRESLKVAVSDALVKMKDPGFPGHRYRV
jgi:hypothetical protein